MGLQDGQAGMAGAGKTEKGQRSEVGETERRRDEETRGKGQDRETG